MSFHPYIKNDPLPTSWYKDQQIGERAESLWSLWYIYYNDKHHLWTLYTNLGKIMHQKNSAFKEDQYLAFHRQEDGLHSRGRAKTSDNKLIVKWYDYLTDFPAYSSLKRYSYAGKLINSAEWENVDTKKD